MSDDSTPKPPVPPDELASTEQEEPGEKPDGVGSPPAAELFALSSEGSHTSEISAIIQRHIEWKLATLPIAASYTVLILYDDSSLARADANRIYQALASSDRDKPILLVIHSRGGDITAGYFIAKLCREYTDRLFEVAVPRQAKSAATLVSCGADRIHMGSLSELGPIDPQFGVIPALALKHSIEHLAQLTADYPSASGMFSDYLAKSLRVEALGYYERVAESAVQYAQRLLSARRDAPVTPEKCAEIAHQLVYAYKDHGFAIDWREATEIFGEDVIKYNTSQYELANTLYTELDFLLFLIGHRFNKQLSFVGAPGSGCMVFEKAS